MDPVTHSLAGATIYNFGFRRKFAFWVILLSSIAPDLDYITRLWGADVFLRYHRGITHGILALFVVPLIGGIIFGYKKGFFYYSFISFLAYAAHLLMDLTNQYGTRILSPLDWEQFSLDLTFIIDPYITLGLLISVVLSVTNKKRAMIISLVTVLLFMSYIGGRYYLHGKIKDFLKEKVDANIYRVCPLPNDFLRWWFITQSGDEIKVGFADLFTQRICIQETYRKDERDPFVQKSKDTRVVRNFLYFARFPYAELMKEKGTVTVVWREMSYSFIPGDHFVAKVIYDKDGRLLNSYFEF